MEARTFPASVLKHRWKVESAVVTVHADNKIGSGSIIRAEGLVITNYHVVQSVINHPGGEPLVIQTLEGTCYSGRVVGSDRCNDLALIQLTTHQRWPTVPIARGKDAQPGQKVWAIGSPFGVPGGLTVGVLSMIRPNGDLQSTVMLNPGHSGGPLLNGQGELIGINKAMLQFSSGQNSGSSLATGIGVARQLIESTHWGAIAPLKTRPSVSGAPSGRGIPDAQPHLRERTSLPTSPFVRESPPILKQSPLGSRELLGLIVDRNHLIVRRVQSGSLSAISGFKPGDRLVAINGDFLRQMEELEAFLNQKPASAVFTVNRNWKEATLKVNF